MSHDPRPGFARFGALSDLLFFECDKSGRVVWMSQTTRLRLGPAASLVDAIGCGNGFRMITTSSAGRFDTLRIRFTRLLERSERVLVGGEIELDRTAGRTAETAGLEGLEGRLASHLGHLLRVERNLADRARYTRKGGHRLVRQMDLERQRLGREVHTGIGQALAAIRLQLEIIGAQNPLLPEPVSGALDRISALAEQALQQVRAVSHRLHPPEWQRLTIVEALRQLWDITGVAGRFEADLRLETLAAEPPHPVKVLFYRAAQEALSNLIRHARATRVEMSLTTAGRRLTLRIRDNGTGFDAGQVLRGPARVAAGIGLRSIREQVEALGGEFHIHSGANGTTLEITLPAELPGEE